MIKNIMLGLLALIVVVAVGIFVLSSNMDSLIKTSIEKYGTEATKAPASLDKVQISVSSGKGSLEGFKLGNPEGFKADSAMKFKLVAIELDTNTVVGEGPVVIRKVVIDAPELTYDVVKDGSSNLQRILDNVKSFANTLPQPTASGEQPAKDKEDSKKNGRKLVVEHLIITNGTVKLSHELLAGKPIANAKLPTIEMSNIGKNTDGVTAASLAEILLQKLSNTAIAAGKGELVDALREQGIESLKGAVEESGVGKAIGNFFGK